MKVYKIRTPDGREYSTTSAVEATMSGARGYEVNESEIKEPKNPPVVNVDGASAPPKPSK